MLNIRILLLLLLLEYALKATVVDALYSKHIILLCQLYDLAIDLQDVYRQFLLCLTNCIQGCNILFTRLSEQGPIT